MPSYFYHLKFELYPTQSPTRAEHRWGKEQSDVWLPPPGTSLFDDLPSHISSSGRTAGILQGQDTLQTNLKLVLNPPHAVIDCGVPSAPRSEPAAVKEVFPERQWLERSDNYPPPSFTAALHPKTAVNDWRFGLVRVESVDPAQAPSIMPGETSRTGAATGGVAAPTLGPSFGGAGTATKAEFKRLQAKNTELGWGVVHFYREGDEAKSPNTDAHEIMEVGELPSEKEDHTTLCIPAVPAYMTPSDFLGFIGERWHDDVTHCRLVTTSKMNRYLALLKFRDGNRAKKWRREFDGKVFNSMGVSRMSAGCL